MASREEMSVSFGAAASAYQSGRPDYPREAVDWMEQYRIAWEEQLDRLGAYLKSKTQGTRHGRKK